MIKLVMPRDTDIPTAARVFQGTGYCPDYIDGIGKVDLFCGIQACTRCWQEALRYIMEDNSRRTTCILEGDDIWVKE